MCEAFAIIRQDQLNLSNSHLNTFMFVQQINLHLYSIMSSIVSANSSSENAFGLLEALEYAPHNKNVFLKLLLRCITLERML